MKKIYDIFCDQDNSWIKVPIKDLKELGIADKISILSRIWGDFAYLAQEDDMLFLGERKMRDEPVEFRERLSTKPSRIRNYPRYQLA